MAKAPPNNVGASVRRRLPNLSRVDGQPFDLLLSRHVLERLLYRLTQTPHRDRFVLKGAMLLTTWFAGSSLICSSVHSSRFPRQVRRDPVHSSVAT
jgi:hypothetical protein